MRTRFLTIFFAIVATLWVMQFYIYRGAAEWLAALSAPVWASHVLLGLLIYFNISIPVRLLIRVFGRQDLKWPKYLFFFPGATWFITMIVMFFFFIAKDISIWLADIFRVGSHRELVQLGGAFSIAAPFIITGYGALKTARDYRIEEVEISSDRLPAAFDGFTIAQISDIHSGMYMSEREMRKIRDLINSLHPQMAALTGDFVDELAKEIEPVARVFSQIKSDFGTFACMGNHDLFDNYSGLSSAMKESGIALLENENRVLKTSGEQLAVLGVADRGRTYRDRTAEQIIEGIEPENFKVLLSHRPNFFARAQKLGIDLQLSGHTHGGQIGLDIFGLSLNLIHAFEKYARGLYEEAKSKLYVNPGVGMVLAPIRIGIPPEITLLKLRRK